MKNEKVYLLHILDANARLRGYFAKDHAAFLATPLIQDATIKVLSNIAESCSFIEEETKKQYPHLPWQKIRGFRNILVHDYLGDLSLQLIWDVVQGELPILVTAIREILQKKYGETI